MVIGVVGQFEKYGFKGFLRSLRAQISPVNGEGVRGRRRGYVEKLFINVSLIRIPEYTAVIEMVTEYKERMKWYRKQRSGPCVNL